jgi:hypothetical protein
MRELASLSGEHGGGPQPTAQAGWSWDRAEREKGRCSIPGSGSGRQTRVIDLDVQKFFDEVPRDLMTQPGQIKC